MTFQRHDDVSKALGMAGRSGQWPEIAGAMGGSWTTRTIKQTLNNVVDLRNRIVHEGGYKRLDRPRKAALSPVAYADAKRAVDFIADLVDAIDAAI